MHGRWQLFFPLLSWWLLFLGHGEGRMLHALQACSACPVRLGSLALPCQPPERAKCCPLRVAQQASKTITYVVSSLGFDQRDVW